MKKVKLILIFVVCVLLQSQAETGVVNKVFPIEDSIWHNLTEAKLKKLIKSGIDINKPVYKGQSPLHVALNGQLTLWNLKVAKLLINNKRCDLEVRDEDGETPLMCAIHNFPSAYLRNVDGTDKIKTDEAQAQEELIQLLIKKGAKTDVEHAQMFSLLHYATYFQVTPEIINLLIKSGVEVNKKDIAGNTPLFYGLDTTIKNILLDAGADINSVNKQKETILHFFLNELSSEEIVPYLVNKQIDLTKKNSDGKTALELALYGRDFFRRKADPNNKNDYYYEKMLLYENAIKCLSKNEELPKGYFDKRIIGIWQSFEDGSVFTKFDSSGILSMLGTDDIKSEWSVNQDTLIINDGNNSIKSKFEIIGDTLLQEYNNETMRYLKLKDETKLPVLPLQVLPTALQYVFDVKDPILLNFSSAYIATDENKNELIDTWKGKSFNVMSSDFMFSLYEDGTIKTVDYGNTWDVVSDTLYLREKSGVTYPLQFSIKDENKIIIFDEVNVLELERAVSR